MGKRIISQARGHGSLTYRVRTKAYKFEINYPKLNAQGKAKIIKLLNSSAHTAPLAKILINGKVFYNPAAKNIVEGQEILMNGTENGDITELKDIPLAKKIFNIEIRPGDGGKLIRTGGSSAVILNKDKDTVKIMMPSKKEIILYNRCRATIGEIAGAGRTEKPLVKAGKKHHMMKARNKLWPRTSALKGNAVDHPFGSGRGKRIKSKIAKRNAPPGARVGTLRPSRTGRRK